MDESSLEISISEYKAQLLQIQNLLATSDDLTKLELYDLEKDLKEMMKIAEESLLSMKKKKLLSSLDEAACCSNVSNDKINSVEHSNIISGIGNEGGVENIDNDNDDEIPIDFVGTKCKVKYTQEWGSFQYHNAMILNCDVDDSLGEVKVHVLFLNPIHKSMVPCKYFLNGNCDYNATCKYSHGYVVDIEELEEYDEPDFSQLCKGCKCLAKFENDGVWYPAIVDNVHEEQATVSFDTYKETLTLDFHSILPISSLYTSDNSSEDDELDDAVDRCDDFSYKPVLMSGPMGEWEQYTKGIGSKLMMKMGYIFGKGLGKDGQGKIEPVEIRLLPPGKSLDYVAELREKGLIKDPLKIKNKKNKSLASVNNSESAFDIINKLTHSTQGIGNPNEFNATSSKFSIEDSYKSLKKHLRNRSFGDAKIRRKNNDTKLNVEMFKVSEKIIALKKKLTLQNEALARNPADTAVSRRIKQNIEATETEIDELKRIDKSLQDKLQMKKQSKKLTVF